METKREQNAEKKSRNSPCIEAGLVLSLGCDLCLSAVSTGLSVVL